MKYACLIVWFFLIQSFTHAISEEGYQEKWETEVFPFFLDHTEFKYMMSHDNKLQLHYGLLFNKTSNSNQKLVLLLPGRSEPFYKYSELAYDLYQEGYSIAFFDHRGQGGSERVLENSEKGHVKSFKYYVHDLEKFMDEVISPYSFKKRYLIAHSMGAAASMMLMAKRNDLFDKAVLSSPMLEPNTGKFKPSVALAYGTALRLLGKGEQWAPGESGYETGEFENNRVTQSKARWEMSSYLYENYDEFKMGGVTVDWITTSLGTNNRFVFKYRKVKTPVLLLRAGNDSVVFTRRHEKFCAKAQKCTLVDYPSAKHEVLMEVDSIRNDILERTFKFFK